MSALIVQLEANSYTPHLYRNDTYYTNLQCQAAYDPDLDGNLRSLITRSLTSDRALSNLESQIFKTSPQYKAMGGTTQAVDIIGGGVKVNALPEDAFAIVNHRIAGHRYAIHCRTWASELPLILLPYLLQFRLCCENAHVFNLAPNC